jgi:hypothetical protein
VDQLDLLIRIAFHFARLAAAAWAKPGLFGHLRQREEDDLFAPWPP